MGFRNIVKAIFGPKYEKESVNLENINAWASEKANKIIQTKEEADKQVYEEFSSTVSSLKAKIDSLEKESLRNENISAKMKNYMTGNRESYIKQAKLFLENLPDFDDKFHNEFQNQLQDFSEKTKRNFLVLTEFFKDNMVDFAKDFKRLDELSNQMNYDVDRVALAHNLKKEVESLVNFDSLIEERNNKIEELNKDIDQNLEKINNLQSQISELKAGKEYARLEELGELIKTSREDLKKKEYEFLELFTNLRKHLKKFLYITISDKKMVELYVEDPIEAVQKDPRYVILDILYRMEKSVSNIDVKEHEKIKFAINNITKERLEQYVKSFKSIKKLIRESEQEIEEIEVVKEIANLDSEVEQIKNQVVDLESSKESLEKEIETFNKEEIKDAIRQYSRDLLNVDLMINK